ncbi:MAG: hypothetical protein U0N09_01385, partial [Alistipes dispar]
QEWAMVPPAGEPYISSARVQAVPAQASSMQVRFRIMVVKVGFVSVFTKVARLPESDGGDLRI